MTAAALAMPDAGLRRGWCPSVLAPMETGDGWLVRIQPPRGALTAAQARAVAGLALRCGNGLIDITSRGNLQLRGVSEGTQESLVAGLIEAGVVEPGDRLRRCILSPLAGLDPGERIDVRSLADRIEAELEGLGGLPPKVAVVVEGGDRWPLDEVEADLRLAAIEGGLALGISAAGGTLWLGPAALQDAPGLTRTVLARFQGLIAAGHPAHRLRGLGADETEALVAGLPLRRVAAPHSHPRMAPVGVETLAPSRAALALSFPFGRCEASTLAELAAWGEAQGSGELRFAPQRSLVLPGLAPAAALALRDSARERGMIVDVDDPRLRVAACPGAPACSRATTPTYADASHLAAAGAKLIAAGATLHVSGCAKGCARAAPADVTLVGRDGRYGVVLNGTAGMAPPGRHSVSALAGWLRGIDDPSALRPEIGA